MSKSGDIDLTFGINGKVVTPFSGDGARAFSGVLQDNGYIVIAGYHDVGTSFEFVLARYNTFGNLDANFGTGGIVNYSFGANSRSAIQSVKLQSDGKIIAGGWTTSDNIVYKFAVARFNIDGSLDTTFGPNQTGVVTTELNNGGMDRAYSVAIGTDDSIILGGWARGAGFSSQDFGLVKYEKDGGLDTSFGTNNDGKVITDFNGNNESLNSIGIQNDGKIVAGGMMIDGFTEKLALARYNTDGSLDTSFGPNNNGKVITPITSSTRLNGSSIAIKNNGKILLGGWVELITPAGPVIGSNDEFMLVQYNIDGSLDSIFGSNGLVIVGILPGVTEDKGYSIAVQPNGQIILAGSSEIGYSQFAMYRFNINGSIDTRFGTNGKVTTDFNATTDNANQVLLQSNGDIILAGTSFPNQGGNPSFAMARYYGYIPPPPIISNVFLTSLNKNGAGVRRSTRFSPGGTANINQPGFIYNRYSAGNSGVGGQSIAVRRAKNRQAAFCDFNPKCPNPKIIQNQRFIVKRNNGYFM